MEVDKKKAIRDSMKLVMAFCCIFLYIPHLLVACKKSNYTFVFSDVAELKKKIKIKLKNFTALVYLLHNDRYYRKLFYYRIGPIAASLIGWWRPGDRYFIISPNCKIGKGVVFAHPYSTIINAKEIGDNFSFIHLTTLGQIEEKRATIGNNVVLGANVNIIGDVKIGDNVIIGAGSVVVKDIPSNCIAAGNPAKVIKYLGEEK